MESPGRIERRLVGNGRSPPRTRRRRKALKSTSPSEACERRVLATRRVRSGFSETIPRSTRKGRRGRARERGRGTAGGQRRRGDTVRLSARNILRGVMVRRGEWLRPGNAANPRVGSGVQQTRDLRAEKAVEAVRNREDGTGPRAWQLEAEGQGGDTRSGSGRT
jgi:hypothetical protein